MDLHGSPVRWALTGQKRGADSRREVADEKSHRATRRRLLCAHCELPITSEEERIEVAERHEHICTNPHGFAYRIGCFAVAPGAAGIGRAESFWSWFPGYSWQLVLCRGCHSHLGWLFRAASTGFYGLILDRLVPEA